MPGAKFTLGPTKYLLLIYLACSSYIPSLFFSHALMIHNTVVYVYISFSGVLAHFLPSLCSWRTSNDVFDIHKSI